MLIKRRGVLQRIGLHHMEAAIDALQSAPLLESSSLKSMPDRSIQCTFATTLVLLSMPHQRESKRPQQKEQKRCGREGGKEG